MKRIAVFCGSSTGASPIYMEEAIALGKELARRKLELVYGGSCVGLMGAIADSVVESGGKVIGVLPDFLQEKEIAHPALSELIIVKSMHERKAKMTELADGFITLPGGAGTMEEFFEIFTWAQLGLHKKPLGILNINHYYDPLVGLINHMADAEFLQEQYRSIAIVDVNPKQLLDQFTTYTPPAIKTFIEVSQS
ncbi:putative lysine decarboxylase [Niallia circulans]|uniref:LOG family protein n=1 Tax=Niallia circulans TaxID=1397 RepID=UPI00077C1340|nr:TIGR00730 family Rossman fold protein [Niallia circulans]MDR4315237.1 TIGR00730 family Rossman fold protein [Niallia circulans]MED3840891.1 TIGR00730 family Rossman fold protein [Niallia circulans]MED4241462.1 TIGR00730 family Rossman fold protein [Niallia circulans]MED4248122.1 TIGR00730 family Rossman fold protein [Niallia circulans]QKH63883.1 TIGR00730 family Rossman fold protein [Niallia circulans]